MRAMEAAAPSRMKMADFEVLETVAKGSFGTVVRARRTSDGREFAIKEVEMKGMTKAEREECIDEARVMSALDSPYAAGDASTTSTARKAHHAPNLGWIANCVSLSW